MPVLRTGAPGLLPYFEEAMRAQNFDTVPRFGAKRLREVEAILHDACFRLEELGIPYALVHNDINLGNILIGSEGCGFTDWASAGVSNPIVTLEQLKMQLVQDKRTVPWISRISEAYRKRWREVILDDAIDQALALVPLIAIATHIWSRKEWVLSEQRHDPGVQSYLRSLMRHMSRAAESPTILRALSA
jgi:thiamine kinase-like enzyme